MDEEDKNYCIEILKHIKKIFCYHFIVIFSKWNKCKCANFLKVPELYLNNQFLD